MPVPPAYLTICAEALFVASILAIIGVYVGYPVAMLIISRLFRQPVRRALILPRVSMIIAARNEERGIGQKLENALQLDYPANKFEIIVASDASTDATDDIVRGFAPRGVLLHRQDVRQGKTRAQHRAVSVSTGEILLFSDATTMYQPDVIHQIVRNFADPSVGCVAGQLVYVDGLSSSVGQGCRSYWNYEKVLKSFESAANSLIGVSGCLYAVRRSCQMKLASDMIDDFVIATEIHLQGLRTVYEPEAISMEDTNHRTKDEFRMRVRVIEQTIRALNQYSRVLNPFTHGMFAFQLICHKVLRYLVPAFLLLALLANVVAAAGNPLFKVLLGLQAAGYLLAVAGAVGERGGIKLGPLSIPYYFALVNLATLMAFVKFLRGESHVVWEPIRHPQPTRVAPTPESFSEA